MTYLMANHKRCRHKLNQLVMITTKGQPVLKSSGTESSKSLFIEEDDEDTHSIKKQRLSL